MALQGLHRSEQTSLGFFLMNTYKTYLHSSSTKVYTQQFNVSSGESLPPQVKDLVLTKVNGYRCVTENIWRFYTKHWASTSECEGEIQALMFGDHSGGWIQKRSLICDSFPGGLISWISMMWGAQLLQTSAWSSVTHATAAALLFHIQARRSPFPPHGTEGWWETPPPPPR